MNRDVGGEWTTLLSRLNDSVLSSDDLKVHLPPEMAASRWCGLPPAKPHDIAKAEDRLGVKLPHSYKSFLSVANGWSVCGSFIKRLLPVEEIDWLRSADPHGLAKLQSAFQDDDISDAEYLEYDSDAHMEALRIRYYPDCLLVGQGFESEMVLLNSKIISSDGEWEAIFFATWLPGNQRYRSFYPLMPTHLTESRII